MKFATAIPFGLAALSFGALTFLNATVRAVPETFDSSQPTVQATSIGVSKNAAKVCFQEAERRNLKRPVVGADYSATGGSVEIDTASEVFSCHAIGKRVVKFVRQS